MTYPTSSNYKLFELSAFKGMNCDDSPNRIDDAEATYMNNFWITDNGTLSKRPGFNKISGNANKPIAMIEYNNQLFYATVSNVLAGYAVYHTDGTTTAYCLFGNSAIYTCNDDSKVNFAVFNNTLIFFTGKDIYEYNKETNTFTSITASAYSPLLMINTNAQGAGDTLEQWNNLGYSYKQTFNGDGTSIRYKLAIQELTQNIISVKIDGTELTGAANRYMSGYTDDSGSGIYIQFAQAPAAGTNNIEVHMKLTQDDVFHNATYDKVTEKRNKLLSSYLYTTYGGENDTRLIIGGNDATIYRSSVMDIHYFPENYFQVIGRSDERVTGFAIQYDYCIVFKEKSMWLMQVDELLDGQVSYPVKPLNAEIGCYNSKSIQFVENKPFFINQYKGVMSVVATQLRDERDVQVISDKINPILLSDIKSATYISSCDWDNKYFIALDKKIYIYDYKNEIWYLWTMPTKVMSIYNYGNELYIGSQDTISKLDFTMSYDKVDADGVIDTESKIECEWRSKLYDFDAPQFLKLVKDMYVNMRSADRTSVNFYYTNEVSPSYLNTSYNFLATYSYFDYSKFSYLADDYKPHAERQKIKVKKVVYFQLIAKNSEKEETLDIYNISLRYKIQKYVK